MKNKYVSEVHLGDRKENIEKFGLEWVENVENQAVVDKSHIAWKWDTNGGGYGIISAKTSRPDNHKPLFTTKHYKAIARAIARINWAYKKGQFMPQAIIESVLEKDNPKFNSHKFEELVLSEKINLN